MSLQGKVVYISGPMTGIENFNRDQFNAAAVYLEGQGAVVLNPAILPDGLGYEQYMDIDMAMVRAAHVIAFLPGWRSSTGAQAERALARCRQLPEVLLEPDIRGGFSGHDGFRDALQVKESA